MAHISERNRLGTSLVGPSSVKYPSLRLARIPVPTSEGAALLEAARVAEERDPCTLSPPQYYGFYSRFVLTATASSNRQAFPGDLAEDAHAWSRGSWVPVESGGGALYPSPASSSMVDHQRYLVRIYRWIRAARMRLRFVSPAVFWQCPSVSVTSVWSSFLSCPSGLPNHPPLPSISRLSSPL